MHSCKERHPTQAAAFAPRSTLDRCTRLQNQFGTDDPSSYPTFLPQGGIGGTGPLPEDELFGVMPWEREAFAKVTISPKQLDEAFMGGCQSILDAKLEGYSEEQVKKILDEKGALEECTAMKAPRLGQPACGSGSSSDTMSARPRAHVSSSSSSGGSGSGSGRPGSAHFPVALFLSTIVTFSLYSLR